MSGKFTGWVAHDKNGSKGGMKWEEFEPKKWEETDIEIEISHCGVCGSDIHTLSSGWGETPYPVVVGHELVGKVVRVGKNVKKDIKEGDRAGVGAQSNSCQRQDCKQCSAKNENHCQNEMVQTYAGFYSNDDKSTGGYATRWRGNGHFVFKIPENVASEAAGPMLCGGVTTYSPLRRHGAKGKRVGIVGIGGLGHFGLLWAKALGATKVVAVSRSRAKEDDARKLGADEFIATGEDGWEEKHAGSLDLIVSTVSSPKMPLAGYLNLLGLDGQFVQLGLPEDPLPSFPAAALIQKNVTLGGSLIGAPCEIEEMLQLASDKNVKPWINTIPMSEANKAVQDFQEGKPQYRFCLVN